MRKSLSSAFTLLELMIAALLMVILLVPLITVLESSTRAAALSRDHLIAESMARSIYEYVAYWGSTDSEESFSEVEPIFEVSDSVTCDLNGLRGNSVTELSTAPDDILMPNDGIERFELDGSSPSYAKLLQRFSYTLDISKSEKESVVTSDSEAALFRCDIRVYWKDSRGREKHFDFSNYLAKRKY